MSCPFGLKLFLQLLPCAVLIQGPLSQRLRNYMEVCAGVSSDKWECKASAPSINGCAARRRIPGGPPNIREDNL
eukprot:7968275-Pyramimonas_sp.AAC.1